MNIRMSTKGKRPLRSLTPSDKVHAIQRIHDGESKASVARDIGVPESTLRGWCKNEDKLRFMSRQSAAEKMGGEALSDKLDGSSNLLGGPPEKRQRLDPSMPLNFSNKMKFDELAAFKRAPLTGLDFGANKTLTDLSAFNGLTPDYGAFNGSAKNKVFGADISRPTDPSLAAISPLSSLSHLSGLTGLSQSPLAMSFNELTSNLNLLAQLNPGLAAMSGLNGLAATNNSLRNNNPKAKPQVHSPRSETAERQTGLSVKNWAKQKPSTPTSNDSSAFGLNLSQNETKSQLKNPTNSLMPPQLGVNLPPLPALPEDPLLYWLKSQQAMLGLNNLYPPPPPPLGAASPPIRPSTPQQQSIHASTPPIIPTPLTPSSTPSGSLDDKNSAWFNWCKAFGASLNSLTPAAAAAALHGNPLQQPPTSGNTSGTPAIGDSHIVGKTGFENILYSQLTKDSAPSPSVQSSSSIEQISNETSHNIDTSNKPEDLSSKSTKARSPPISPLPTPAQSPERNIDQSGSHNNSLSPSPIPIGSDGDLLDSEQHHNNTRNSVADCRDVLDNLLYKINNNNGQNNRHVSESEASYNSDHQHHNIDDCTNNNNNNSNKTDEEERAKCSELYENEEAVADYREAIQHGEKFLQWLENFSNPRVTAVQLMQLRFLISSVKSDLEPKSNLKEATSPTNLSTAIEIDDSSEEFNRLKIRRRK